MLAYTAREGRKLALDVKTLSEEISLKVWKKTGYKKQWGVRPYISLHTCIFC